MRLLIPVCLIAAPARPALAFDPLEWLGLRQAQPRADALPYALTFTGPGADRALIAAAREASLLQQLRDDPPATGQEFAGRVEADLPRIVDAVWARGHYAAEVTVRVADASARIGAFDARRIALAAESRRGRTVVPVMVEINPGPLYRLGPARVADARSGRPFDPAALPQRVIGLAAGDPAITADILASAARISDRFREEGRPFVRVTRRPPIIDHRTRLVDLDMLVDPGPFATLGSVSVTGSREVDPAVIRSFIYTQPGDPYSPQAIAGIRRSVARIEALGSIRVREAEALDGAGRLPISVEVTERPPRLIGASARYSTVDGPALRAYWAHRNLFGGAERLRLEADLFYTVLDRDGRRRGFRWEDLGGRISASFLKPALGGSRFDFLADVSAARERTEAYDADLALATLAIRRRFTDNIFAQVGLEAEIGRTRDAPPPLPGLWPVGRSEYALLGLPVSIGYDSTDRPLDPTRGVRLTASAGPYLGFGDAPAALGVGRAQASAYLAFDEAARFVLAGRLGVGAVLGGALEDVPPTRRFYAGGGGSVRGFEHRSLGPRDALGRLTGGRSLFEASLEARIRITDTIGVVPFVDVGQAFARAVPRDFGKLRVGAGVGLRYYTSLGPIRLDVAFPIERRRGEAPYAVYVSIGQAF